MYKNIIYGIAFMISTMLFLGINAMPVFAYSWESIGNDIRFLQGNVGIGASNPTELLTLSSNGQYKVGISQEVFGGKATLELTSQDSLGKQASRILMRGNTDKANIEFLSGKRGSEVVRMFLNGSNGYLGLGTTTPGAHLDITTDFRVGIGGDGGRMQYKYVTGGPQISLYDKDDITSLRFSNSSSSNNESNPEKSAVISSHNGKVGIGTTKFSPSEMLQIKGNLKVNGNIIPEGDICIGKC